MATAESLSTFSNHDDYVRTAAFVPSSPHLYLSGSYDTTVKLWDARASGNEASHQVMSFNHGHPVESILVHPSGTTAISAGGPVIKIWDLLMGSSTPLKTLSNHQKTVTALSWGDKQHSRLLSAGLDGLVKSYTIHDGGDWRVGHTMRFGGQLLSLALAPNDQTLCVGAADGTLSIKSQPPAASQLQSRRAKATQEERPADPRPEAEKSVETTWRSTTGNDRRRVPKLNEWDRLIKVFRYADALDSVMERNNDARTVVAVLDELKHLDGLHQALGSRNDRDLVRILKFMNKQISDPRWGIKISEFVQVLLSTSGSFVEL